MKILAARCMYRHAVKPAEFLAYCSIVRGLRHQHELWNNGPIILGVIIPLSEDIAIYEKAAECVSQHIQNTDPRIRSDDVRVEIFQQQGKGRRSFDLFQVAAEYEKLLLIAASRDLLPDGIEFVADAIVELQPPHMRHVRGGAKLLLEQSLTDEQAEKIATFPLRVVAATWRKGRSPARAIDLMARSVKPTKNPLSGPTLDDLSGLGEAAVWGKELAQDLVDWQRGRISWSDVDRGALVSGPPGCGKTLFAQALAKTCGAHLVAASLAQWQAKGHLGDLLKAMRDAFGEAAKNIPSILFIDEADAIGDRNQFSGHSAHYATEVVNALLECLDGVGGREGVVVVGATNFPEKLDAALIRPGRLDRHIRIPLPDSAGRKGILLWHLKGDLADADLTETVDRTEGWTGAALEQLIRDAHRRARRVRRQMTAEDLTNCLPQRVPVPEHMLRRITAHEAGHVVVNHVLAVDRLKEVSIIDTAEVDREMFQSAGGVSFERTNISERTKSDFLDRIAVDLGGLAAEEFVLGERSAGGGGTQSSDIFLATARALQMEASLGLGECLTYFSAADDDNLLSLIHLNPELRRRVDNVLSEQFNRARNIISNHRQSLDNIATELLRRRKLSGTEVREILTASGRQENTAA